MTLTYYSKSQFILLSDFRSVQIEEDSEPVTLHSDYFLANTKDMSYTFTFSDRSSMLSAEFFPPIELDVYSSYEIGMLSFQTYNTIPNVDESNNKFHFDDNKILTIPNGTYEIKDIADYIREHVTTYNTPEKIYHVMVDTNNNTMRTTIKATVPVDFSQPNSIGSLLGFGKRVLEPQMKHLSDNVADVFRVNTLRIECNIASGSYLNGRPAHTVYEFFPNTPAGYKIVEAPSPVIYVPITVNSVDRITLKVVDQLDRIVNFRGEEITIRLHLRKIV